MNSIVITIHNLVCHSSFVIVDNRIDRKKKEERRKDYFPIVGLIDSYYREK